MNKAAREPGPREAFKVCCAEAYIWIDTDCVKVKCPHGEAYLGLPAAGPASSESLREAPAKIVESCKFESGYTKVATIRKLAEEALASAPSPVQPHQERHADGCAIWTRMRCTCGANPVQSFEQRAGEAKCPCGSTEHTPETHFDATAPLSSSQSE